MGEIANDILSNLILVAPEQTCLSVKSFTLADFICVFTFHTFGVAEIFLYKPTCLFALKTT